MKGIVLAAGKGTRLYPMTKPVCKPLLPVYDKPLLYYPIAALMQAGCRDILIIIPSNEQAAFESLLGDGSEFGIHISYKEQPVARGIADAMLIGADFIGEDSLCLALGDNIFYSENLPFQLRQAANTTIGATVFGYWVEDPRPFGVVEFDASGRAVSIEEKPEEPKSNYIIPGLYFYDNDAVAIARNLKPSARGELEITDVNQEYLNRGQLQVITLDEDCIWMDAGTADSLHEASSVVRRIQRETGRYIGCLEEVALQCGYITRAQILHQGEQLRMTQYGRYLMCI